MTIDEDTIPGKQLHHHELFSDKSDLYASSRPEYPQEIFQYLASICPATQLAWDCACGNGQAATGLITEFDRVYATDVSKQQISNARALPGVTFEVIESEHTKLETDSCDLICVAQALHWFDFDLFWPEARRILKPGGIFSAIGYNWPHISDEIDLQINQGIMEVVKPYWAPQNKLLWDHYRNVEIPFKQLASPKFVMQAEWNLDEFFNLLHTMSATRRCMGLIGDQFFHEAYSAVSGLWGDAATRKTVDLDFVFYAGSNQSPQPG